WPLLDERTRRLMAASEAVALGYGGVSLVHRACGLSRNAIMRGMEEIDAGHVVESRTRRPGAGRKPFTAADPRLLATLERLTGEGPDHPDRDAEVRHINAAVRRCLAQGWPVISVDTKKKELIGNFENAGRQWRRAQQPHRVRTHDFPTPEVPRAYPYGVYDIG